MASLVGIALCVIVIVIAFEIGKVWLRSSAPTNSYKSKPLLSANEKEFYNRLSEALPDYRILTQVALGALLLPNVRSNSSAYYRARASFSQKIADFVICNREMFVVAVVELDDRTHNADRDTKRDRMLEQAGYKVIRWESKRKPTAEQIREQIQSI
jgi:hypothetical protein